MRNPAALLPSKFLSINVAKESSPTILREACKLPGCETSTSLRKARESPVCVIPVLVLLKRFRLSHLGCYRDVSPTLQSTFAEARSLGGGTPLCRRRKQEAREIRELLVCAILPALSLCTERLCEGWMKDIWF